MMKVGICTISQDTKLDMTTQYLAHSLFLAPTDHWPVSPLSFHLMEKVAKYFSLQMDTKISTVQYLHLYVGFSIVIWPAGAR